MMCINTEAGGCLRVMCLRLLHYLNSSSSSSLLHTWHRVQTLICFLRRSQLNWWPTFPPTTTNRAKPEDDLVKALPSRWRSPLVVLLLGDGGSLKFGLSEVHLLGWDWRVECAPHWTHGVQADQKWGARWLDNEAGQSESLWTDLCACRCLLGLCPCSCSSQKMLWRRKKKTYRMPFLCLFQSVITAWAQESIKDTRTWTLEHRLQTLVQTLNAMLLWVNYCSTLFQTIYWLLHFQLHCTEYESNK